MVLTVFSCFIHIRLFLVRRIDTAGFFGVRHSTILQSDSTFTKSVSCRKAGFRVSLGADGGSTCRSPAVRFPADIPVCYITSHIPAVPVSITTQPRMVIWGNFSKRALEPDFFRQTLVPVLPAGFSRSSSPSLEPRNLLHHSCSQGCTLTQADFS